ncbi:MAG: 30S ribosomal protein S16 [Bacteroidetes bacterium]|nr:30S ribosomal protein S16 [Bacteroidota bacterium]
MSVKIRLQRFGRKRNAFYHIVVADARAPRDGKSIERIGSYNPNTNPATIDVDVNKAAQWLQNGAQPTDTARAILSYKGVLYKHHLNRGVAKGALTQEQADAKFEKWLEEKSARIQSKIDGLSGKEAAAANARAEAERKINEERAAKIAAKNSPVAEEVEAVVEEVEPVAVETEVVEEAVETPVAEEAIEEAPAAEAGEETPTAEANEEAPAAETEEKPEA